MAKKHKKHSHVHKKKPLDKPDNTVYWVVGAIIVLVIIVMVVMRGGDMRSDLEEDGQQEEIQEEEEMQDEPEPEPEPEPEAEPEEKEAEIVEDAGEDLGSQDAGDVEVLSGITCAGDNAVKFTVTNLGDQELYFNNAGVPSGTARVGVVLNGNALANLECEGKMSIAAGESLMCEKSPVVLAKDRSNRLSIVIPDFSTTQQFNC